MGPERQAGLSLIDRLRQELLAATIAERIPEFWEFTDVAERALMQWQDSLSPIAVKPPRKVFGCTIKVVHDLPDGVDFRLVSS